jgi:hypothetical protein
MNPKLAGKVEIGGIARGTKHPNGKDFVYGPQMVEISRDGKRVYWTNSLYSTWDDQFYPDDEGGQMVMANVGENGGLELDKDFYIEFPKGYRSAPDPAGRRRLLDRQLLLPQRLRAANPALKTGRRRPSGGPSSARALSWGQPRHGLAAGCFCRADGAWQRA